MRLEAARELLAEHLREGFEIVEEDGGEEPTER
jgi:hypothetical protein